MCQNETLPCSTGYFGLGFFPVIFSRNSNRSQALSGFSELNEDSFSIITHYLTDCAHSVRILTTRNSKIYKIVWCLCDYDFRY